MNIFFSLQLRKEQGDERGDEQGDERGVNQTVEAPWSKRTQLEEQQHSSHFLNRTALRKKTLLLLNSQMERMRKGGEEKGEEEIQPSCIGEIQIGNEDLGYAEMKSGKEKEEPDCDGDCSTDADSRSPDLLLTGFSICSSVMDSYIPLPSPPKPHSCQMPIFVSVNKSDIHHFNETFKNSNRGATISTEQSSLSASSAVDWNCPCSDLSKTSCNLIICSTPRSLTSLRPISMLNTTQPGLLKIKKTQRNHPATHQRIPLAPLNQSYDVESPSPTVDHLRPQIRSASEASTFIRHRLELGRLPKHRMKQEDVAAADILQNEAVGKWGLEQTQRRVILSHRTSIN